MNQRRRLAIVVLCIATLAMLTGCGGGGGFSFDVADPALSLVQGETVSMEVPFSRSDGFTGEVAFSVSRAPDGVEALFEPEKTTDEGSTLKLTAHDNAPVGSHELIVRGESGRIEESFTLTLEVQPAPDFGILLPSTYLSLEQGERTEVELTVERTGGFAEDVRLMVTDPPEPVTAELLQENDRAILYLDVHRGAPEGSFDLELAATTEDLVRTATLEVNVVGVTGLDLTTDPSSLQLTRDDSQEITVHVARWGGFDLPVTLELDGLPDGVHAEISPNPIPNHEGTITLSADDTARLGTFAFTVSGSAEGFEATTFVDMSIVGR